MSKFFNITKEDIQKAASGGGNPSYMKDEMVQFMIKEVNLKDKDGVGMLIVNAEVMNTASKGATHKFFLMEDNPVRMSQWIGMVRTKFTEQQIEQGMVTPVSMMGHMMQAPCNHKEKNGKVFQDFYDFRPVTGGPGTMSVAPGQLAQDAANVNAGMDIPF